MDLVIGYGNDLRRDDGAGPVVARALEALGLPGLRVGVAHQLLPEHAELLARTRRVVFVDAAVGRSDEVACAPLDPATAPLPGLGHGCDPAALVAMAEALYGSKPRAWIVTIPAHDLALGEGLTEETRKLLPSALAAIRAVIEKIEDHG